MMWDDPPHTATLYSVTEANDASGGVVKTYTLAQAAVPCQINTASTNTQLIFAQSQQRVSHTVGILSSELTATPKPGWKVVADTSLVLILEGISSGRVSPMGTIPALTYLHCSELL